MQYEQDLYAVLGVSTNATIEDIKRAYRKLAFKHHPDRNQMNQESSQIMDKINVAYAILSDRVKRKEYDLVGGSRSLTPKFNKGSHVRVKPNSLLPYRDHSGIVGQEPTKDMFRFWYMVELQLGGFSTVVRVPEEELDSVGE